MLIATPRHGSSPAWAETRSGSGRLRLEPAAEGGTPRSFAPHRRSVTRQYSIRLQSLWGEADGLARRFLVFVTYIILAGSCGLWISFSLADNITGRLLALITLIFD